MSAVQPPSERLPSRRGICLALVAASLLAASVGLSGCSASRPSLLDTTPSALRAERAGAEIDADLERKVTRRLHLPDTSRSR